MSETNERTSVTIKDREWQCDGLAAGQGRRCLVLHEPEPCALLVQPVEAEELAARDGLLEEVATIREAVSVPLAVAFISVDDWNRELSPWQAPPVFGKQAFGAGAGDTLALIEELLPELRHRYGLPDGAPTVLGGYSLAALFSLWSTYESASFAAIAAASPSVWFPGWLDYAKSHHPQAKAIYLSLGDREAKTRNPVMCTVSTCIEEQHALLQQAGIKTTLAWNPGNHFQHPEQRCAKAFAWCLEQMFLL